MNFQDNLSAMPDISHLSGLDVLDAQGKVLHHIPAVQGKLGSLKLYNALTQEFDNRLDSAAASLPARRILVHNHSMNKTHTLTLLSAC